MESRMMCRFQGIGHGYKNDAGAPDRGDDDEGENQRANPHHDLLPKIPVAHTYQTLAEKDRVVSQPLVVGAWGNTVCFLTIGGQKREWC
jgi:hypothetical protein